METHKPWHLQLKHIFIKSICTNARTQQKKIADPLLQQTLADFKVGVDNVIFSVDTSANRLLVLLVMRQQEPF